MVIIGCALMTSVLSRCMEQASQQDEELNETTQRESRVPCLKKLALKALVSHCASPRFVEQQLSRPAEISELPADLKPALLAEIGHAKITKLLSQDCSIKNVINNGSWSYSQGEYVWDTISKFLSPDGKFLIVNGTFDGNRRRGDQDICVWNLANGICQFKLNHEYGVQQCCFSQDSSKLLTIAITGDGCRIGWMPQVWDLVTGKLLWKGTLRPGEYVACCATANSFLVLPKGGFVEEKVIYSFNAETGDVLAHVDPYELIESEFHPYSPCSACDFKGLKLLADGTVAVAHDTGIGVIDPARIKATENGCRQKNTIYAMWRAKKEINLRN